MSTAEWSRFKVGKKSNRSNWTEPSCEPFDTVAHVTHINSALRVIEDGKISARLIRDDCKLNTRRIEVVWLSPNYWTNGFMYGNVRFTVDWPTVVRNLNYYWVESVAYKNEACRILVTDQDRSKFLTPYDPMVRSGPWWIDADGTHYRNANYTLEFMCERAIGPDEVTKIDFVKHHKSLCNIDSKNCPDCGRTPQDAGAQFIAAIIYRGLGSGLGLTKVSSKGRVSMKEALESAVAELDSRILQIDVTSMGAVKRKSKSGKSLAYAVLGGIGFGRPEEELRNFLSMFKSPEEARLAIRDTIGKAFKLTDIHRELDA